MSRKSGIFNFIKLPNLMVGLVVACVCLWCGGALGDSMTEAAAFQQALGDATSSSSSSSSTAKNPSKSSNRYGLSNTAAGQYCEVYTGTKDIDASYRLVPSRTMAALGDYLVSSSTGKITEGICRRIVVISKDCKLAGRVACRGAEMDVWQYRAGPNGAWGSGGRIDDIQQCADNKKPQTGTWEDVSAKLVSAKQGRTYYVKQGHAFSYSGLSIDVFFVFSTRNWSTDICWTDSSVTGQGSAEQASAPKSNSKVGSASQNPQTTPKTTTPASTTAPVDAKQEQETTASANTTAPAASSGGCNSRENCDRSCVSGAESVQFTGGYCVATECKPDHYKVKDARGAYHGWCIYISCPADQEPNIDAQEMWDQTTDKCRAKSTSTVAVDPAKTVVEETGGTEKTSGDAAEASVATSATTPAGPADGDDCHDIKANSTNATYMNGECIVHDCMAGYEKKSKDCVKISGPCKSLPAHAVRGHRKYNADTGDTECIIDDCDDGYVVADDKLSCHEDYDAQAEAAREREQSTGNKLIGALGMGATGIGGSMLMSGLAESAADDDAERAMTAYLETFTCKYGNESVSGGTMNVEIPGGNELINMYSEYVALANDLKMRKAALGMKPGIESEPILDSATSGLYDDVGTGRGKGAYASLARALENPDGEDAKAWAAQREETQKKTKTGAITAGVGAGASLIGNIAINGDKDNEDNDDDDEF